VENEFILGVEMGACISACFRGSAPAVVTARVEKDVPVKRQHLKMKEAYLKEESAISVSNLVLNLVCFKIRTYRF
jgi:hypothetical protein